MLGEWGVWRRVTRGRSFSGEWGVGSWELGVGSDFFE